MSQRHAILVLAVAAIGGCASTVQGRFHDRPIVRAVQDAHDIPEPSEREFYPLFYLADALVFDRVLDTFDPPHTSAARNTNSVDEVPDSTWFVNRLAVREVSPIEAATGNDGEGLPQAPLTIVKAKQGGANPGFIIADARDVRYLVKFDTAANPEQQTATDAIVDRILWTLGYNVPSDHVLEFARTDLVLGPKVAGKLSERDVDRILTAATRLPDGRYRASISQLLSGIPKGGWPPSGVREDDPNDRIPHQFRRELRGLRVFAAWLGHTDMKEDNSLDMYITDGDRHFLRHYLVDFGEAFGGHQSEKKQPMIGWEYAWDFAAQGRAFVSLGLWVRPWEGQRETSWKSVGYFGASHFDPDEWKSRYPYEPFYHTDLADSYWAAKLVMRFDRPMLEAIVATGKLSEPAAASYLVDTLLARRDKIGRAYLTRVTALDELAIESGELCGVDLATRYGFAPAGTAVVRDRPGNGGASVSAKRGIDASGVVCLPLATDGGYHVLRVAVERGGSKTPPMQIHYIGGPQARIVGLIRIGSGARAE